VAQQVSRLLAEAVCARPGEASLLPPGALDDPQHLEVASLQRLSGLVWPWRLSEAVWPWRLSEAVWPLHLSEAVWPLHLSEAV
jgi:hypothetical protein